MAGRGKKEEISDAEEEEDLKSRVPRLVTLKVVSQERVIKHTMSVTDKLQVLMDVWYHKMPEVTYGTGAFVFDGCRLGAYRTPEEMEMEDGDAVDFFEGLTGGAFVA
jgi:small ubiquitin-related modifier